MNNMPIGVLDSGIGGLTVLQHAIKEMPHEKFIFIGDQKNMPYGPRSKEDVTNLTRKLVQYLISREVKAVVFACNTATAEAMDEIQAEVDIPLIGVIKPGSQAAVDNTQHRLGIIATEGTIKSGQYKEEVHKLKPEMLIFDKAAPTFVPMIESGVIDPTIIKNELQFFDDKNIESIILGCTHYPIIAPEIEAYFQHQVKIINPAFNTVKILIEVLTANDALGDQAQQVEYFTTGDSVEFDAAITRILGVETPQSATVILDD